MTTTGLAYSDATHLLHVMLSYRDGHVGALSVEQLAGVWTALGDSLTLPCARALAGTSNEILSIRWQAPAPAPPPSSHRLFVCISRLDDAYVRWLSEAHIGAAFASLSDAAREHLKLVRD